jgi:AraC-like DNA-binding protein
MIITTPQTVELRVFNIGQELLSYKYTLGSICLFVTSSNQLTIPMGPRSIPLPPHSIYLFYDQQRNFDLNFAAEQISSLVVIKLSIDTLHHIIAQGTDEINFSQSAIFEKEQYHHFEPASDEIKQCILDILENQNNIFLQEAKKFELLNYYFNSKNVQTYKCPFLNQKDNVIKVRDAKKALIADLHDSPTIKELAKIVGLNEYNLKTGFKEIYGKPVHAYLKDYKMIKAKEMIESRDKQINEIADTLGYTNVSHFIDAFKKKYGQTPKQFELNSN